MISLAGVACAEEAGTSYPTGCPAQHMIEAVQAEILMRKLLLVLPRSLLLSRTTCRPTRRFLGEKRRQSILISQIGSPEFLDSLMDGSANPDE